MNKKKWIAVVVFLALIIVGLIGYLVYQGSRSEEEKLLNYTEGTNQYTGLSKSVVVAYDVLKGEVELKYAINQDLLELGTLETDVFLLNKSQKTIKQTEAALRVLDDKNKVLSESYVVFFNVKPGETIKLRFSTVYLKRLDGEVKKVTITLWKIWGDATTTPPKTTTTVSPSTTTTAPAVTQGSPGQTVKDFYQAWADGKYDDLKKYLSAPDLQKLASVANGYQQWFDVLKQQNQSNPIKSVEILKVDIVDGGKKADAYYRIYHKTGSEELGGQLVLEGTVWKMVIWPN